MTLGCQVEPARLPPGSAHSSTRRTEPLYAVANRRDEIGRIATPVQINGAGPFRFLLDTGANRSAIAESTAHRLGLTLDPEQRVSVQGVNGTASVATALVTSLEAGAVRFDNHRFPVLVGAALAELDGILGADALEGKKVSVDFRHDRTTILTADGKRAALRYAVIRGSLLSGKLIMVKGRVNRLTIRIIIDTGASRTLGNPALLARLTGRRDFDVGTLGAQVTDATQTRRPGEVHLLPEITIGTANVRKVDVTFGDFQIFRIWGLDQEPALLVGMDILGTLSELVIDYRRVELQLLAKSW